MPTPIVIRIGDVELDAELNDSQTAAKIAKALPIEASYNVWGDEVFFATSVRHGPEDARETVALGDLAYWPPGKAFCIFYGRTPASKGDEIRPASPVNPIGRVVGDASVLAGSVPGKVLVKRKE